MWTDLRQSACGLEILQHLYTSPNLGIGKDDWLVTREGIQPNDRGPHPTVHEASLWPKEPAALTVRSKGAVKKKAEPSGKRSHKALECLSMVTLCQGGPTHTHTHAHTHTHTNTAFQFREPFVLTCPGSVENHQNTRVEPLTLSFSFFQAVPTLNSGKYTNSCALWTIHNKNKNPFS